MAQPIDNLITIGTGETVVLGPQDNVVGMELMEAP